MRRAGAVYRRFRKLAPEARGWDRLALAWLFLRIGAAVPLLAWAIRRRPLPALLDRLTPGDAGRWGPLPLPPPRHGEGEPFSENPGAGADTPPSLGGKEAGGLGPCLASEPAIVRCVDYWLGRRRLCYQPTCLLRALTLYRFLREAGFPVVIHYGVARNGAGLAGHSWLTLNGRPHLEAHDPETRFRRVYSYPPEVSG